jgi:peptidyl-prolyl cis-trans isomerase C
MKRMFVALLTIIVLLSSNLLHADDAVVARVDNASITASELEAAIDQLIPRSTFHGNITEEKRKEYREKALNDLIEKMLMFQDAQKRGIKPDKKMIKEQMGKIRDRFKTKNDYSIALERAGITERDLETRVARNVAIQNVYEKTVTAPARVNDADLRDYYNKNITKFKQPERVKLSLISTKDRQKADEALAKIKSGEKFASVAEAMSEDQYRVLGGDLGYQHRGKLLPEIENVAFSMKIGELSGIINAEGLWFIIRLEDKKSEQQMTFEESRDKLKKDLESKREKELNDKWMEQLKARAKIENLLKTADNNLTTEDKEQKTGATTTQQMR